MAIKGKKAPESFCYLNPNFTEDHPMIVAQKPGHEVNIWPDEARHPGLSIEHLGFTVTLYASAVALALFTMLGLPLLRIVQGQQQAL